jgi:hypothetical protein
MSAHSIGIGQAGNLAQFANPLQAQQGYTSQQSAALQQQSQATLAQMIQQVQERQEWMINGKPMTFKEFADTFFPEDTAERTMFYLKYSK